jgi:hypothetical protein
MDGADRDPERLGDRRRAQPDAVPQHDDRAALQRQARDRVEELGVTASRSQAVCAFLELGDEPALSTQHVEGAVDDDAVEPGPEGPARVEPVEPGERPLEGVLRDVVGQRATPRQPVRRPPRPLPVAQEQRGGSLARAPAGLRDELPVAAVVHRHDSDTRGAARHVPGVHTDGMRIALAAAVAAAACVAATPRAGAAAPTGLQGTVTRGPTMPVCRSGEPCSAPAAQIVLVFRRSGVAVRTRTDTQGRYRVTLAAGTWQVSLVRRGIGMAIEPERVRAVPGRMRTVDLSIDTGIR